MTRQSTPNDSEREGDRWLDHVFRWLDRAAAVWFCIVTGLWVAMPPASASPVERTGFTALCLWLAIRYVGRAR